MSGNRWRVAGLADPRAAWFSELARLSTAAAVPVDFVKCVSADEVRTRLVVGEAFSALLLGSDGAGVDRSLVAEAEDHGTAVIVVGEAREGLGPAAVLPADFDRDDLMAALTEHASPRTPAEDLESRHTVAPAGWLGRLVSVTGPGGAGASLLAMSLAGGLAAEASNRWLVMLADLALDADQAMMHDSRDVIPGLQELVEACPGEGLSPDLLRSIAFEPEGRGYHLLLGLRRHRDWGAVGHRAMETVLDGLMRTYRFVVADTDPDIEGLSDTGSAEVEMRNVLARTAIGRSDLVMVVGTGGTKGLCSLARTVETLVNSGADPDRLLPVVNRVPRGRRHRNAPGAALTRLMADPSMARVHRPLLVHERRGVESAIRDGVAPPASLGRALASQVQACMPTRSGRAAPIGTVACGPGRPS